MYLLENLLNWFVFVLLFFLLNGNVYFVLVICLYFVVFIDYIFLKKVVEGGWKFGLVLCFFKFV